MFVCETCHHGEMFKNCWLCELGRTFMGSFGKCEMCGEVADCTDCHSY